MSLPCRSLSLAALLLHGGLHAQFSEAHVITGHPAGGVIDLILVDVDGDGNVEPITADEWGNAHWFPINDQLEFTHGYLIAPELEYTSCVDAGDLNGDTYPDVVVGGSNDGRIVWAANDGGEGFEGSYPIDSITGPVSALQLADLDNDGDLDLVVASAIAGSVGVALNTGSGSFSTVQAMPGSFPDVLAFDVDHIDGDGMLDLVLLYGTGTQMIAWCPGLGTGAFGAAQSIPASIDYCQNVHAHDMNGDGIIDVVAQADSDLVLWLAGVGDGTFTNGGTVTTPQAITHVNLVDADLNGDMDLLGMGSSGAFFYINNGSGTLTYVTEFPTSATLAEIGDVDGDGTAELVWGDDASQDVEVYDANGGLNFVEIGPGFVAPHALEAELEDLDGDGDLDLVARTGLYQNVDYWLYANDGQGNFTHELELPGAWEASANLITSDIDGDGLPDLVVREEDPDGTMNDNLWWRRNLGGFTFGPVNMINDILTYQSYHLAAGDVDSDGDNDVLLVRYNGTAKWFRNLGGGVFDSGTVFYTATGNDNIRTPLIADVNGDGANDILLPSNGPILRVFIFLSNGPGTFAPAMSTTETMDPMYMVAGDLDGDGDVDLVCDGQGQYNLRVLLNDGNADFSVGPTLNGGNYTRSIRLSDLDLDGDLDVVGVYNESIWWMPNNGTGTFGAAIDLDVMQPPMYEVGHGAVGDVDGDGFPDVVVAANNGPIPYFWLHNALGDRARIEGQVFFDMDDDGVRDMGEPPVPWCEVGMTPGLAYLLSTNNGAYVFHVDAGTYTVEPLIDTTLWRITTDSSYTATLADLEVSDGNDFGLLPLAEEPLVELTLTNGAGWCGAEIPLTISTANLGSTVEHGLIVLELDTLYAFVEATPPPDSLSGQTYYWSYTDLLFYEVRNITVNVIRPAAENNGLPFTNTVVLYRQDTLGAVLDTLSTDWAGHVSCPYDPNDKQVFPKGYGTYGAVDVATSDLNYVIRFQNTGTATAHDVTLIDTLSGFLDLTAINLLGYSHMPTEIQLEDHIMRIHLQGIQLPDSASDMAGSQGFVRFSIGVLQPAAHMTAISNSASIVFDNNDPVITNTVLTTLVDCALWQPEAEEVAPNVLQATAGDAYQWFLYGDTLDGFTAQEIIITIAGSYSVSVTSVHGCTAMSEAVIMSSINDATSGDLATLRPNPASDRVILLLSEPAKANSSCQLMNAQGSVLRQWRLPTGTVRSDLEREGLAAGTYFLRLTLGEGTMQVMPLIWR